MSKKLNALFAKTASLPSVEERMQNAAAEQPTAEPESSSIDDSLLGPKKLYQTGAGAATHAARLESKIEALQANLKKALADQAAIRIPVGAIDPNPWQPRIHFDDASLQQLATSISIGGVMAPVAVRRNPDNPERYQLIAGERRLRACKLAGKEEIPAVMLELSNEDTAANALAENLLRDNLTDYEIGMAMMAMESQFPSKAKMCETFGVSRSQLYRLFSFEKLPAFMTETLEEQPGLLSAKSSEALLKLFVGIKDSDLFTAVNPIWNKLIRQRINQGEFLKEVEKTLTKSEPLETSLKKTKEVLLIKGKKIGTLVMDTEQLALKLKLSDIPNAQQVELLTYLKTQFNVKA